MLPYDWSYESKYVNGPNQYEGTAAGYKVILINNVKGHGNWIVTSEIKNPDIQFVHPAAGKTLNLTIENEKYGVVVLRDNLRNPDEDWDENYFDTQKYDPEVELEEYAKE